MPKNSRTEQQIKLARWGLIVYRSSCVFGAAGHVPLGWMSKRVLVWVSVSGVYTYVDPHRANVQCREYTISCAV